MYSKYFSNLHIKKLLRHLQQLLNRQFEQVLSPTLVTTMECIVSATLITTTEKTFSLKLVITIE